MTGVRHHLPSVDDAHGLGKALVAVDPSLLRKVEGKHRRWFKGNEPYLTLTVDDDSDGLCFVELCVRGRFARRARGGPLETGITDELELSVTGMPSARMEQIQGERADVLAVAQALLEGAGLVVESGWLKEG